MGFLIVGFAFMMMAVFIVWVAECNDIRYNKTLIVFFLFLGISMFVTFTFCPRAEYKEPELVYEVCLDEESTENIGVELSEANLNEIISLSDDVNEINYIKPTNLKFVNNDLTDGIIVRIYKSVPEQSFWKPAPGEVVYDCVIHW